MIVDQFAKRISSLTWEDLSAQVRANSKTAILDTVGVTLAGSTEDAAKLLLRVPGVCEAGPSLIFGRRVRTSALSAALVNGVAAHAMDFDDVNIALGGHPSAPIVPAIFAVAEMIGASGRELITAFVAGFETNPEWRTRYLRQDWGHAKVSGSNFNYGDGLRMALDMGAEDRHAAVRLLGNNGGHHRHVRGYQNQQGGAGRLDRLETH